MIPPRQICQFSQIFRHPLSRLPRYRAHTARIFPTFSTNSSPFFSRIMRWRNTVMSPFQARLCKKLFNTTAGPDCEILCEDCGKPELFHIFHRFFHRPFPPPFLHHLFTDSWHNVFDPLFPTPNFLLFRHFHGHILPPPVLGSWQGFFRQKSLLCKINEIFFKLGIDFIEKLRYNVGLYEHL